MSAPVASRAEPGSPWRHAASLVKMPYSGPFVVVNTLDIKSLQR